MAATYTGSFELRRFLAKFARTPAGGTVEDVDVISVHFAKLVSGAPDPGWTTGNYTTVEGAFDTLWTNLKNVYNSTTVLGEYRWYKDGPAWSPIDRGDGPPNPAERITTRSVAGAQTLAGQLPPQVAISVTKIVPIRKRWGRLYLPAIITPQATSEGRLSTTWVNNITGYFVTFFNTCRAASLQPVVWSRATSAYVSTLSGASIPAHGASAYEITDVQVDNLFDVIRSRRYDGPTVRTRTALT